MNRSPQILLRALGFLRGMLADMARDVYALARGILCWVWQSKSDFGDAYRQLWMKIRGKESSRTPLEQTPLPGAGSGARTRAFQTKIVVAILMGVYIGIMLVLFSILAPIFIGVLANASIDAINVWVGRAFWIMIIVGFLLTPVLVYQHENYNLGDLGERAVGNELDKLGRSKWRIFHGVRNDKTKGDIDHIIVCAKGVFCVETKTLRKRPDKTEELCFYGEGNKGEVLRDGKKLPYKDPIEQARRNAADLCEYLRNNGAPVSFVVPIITFPGWELKNGGHCHNDMIVCKPEDILKCLLERDNRLSEEDVQTIAAVLDEKNRADINAQL